MTTITPGDELARRTAMLDAVGFAARAIIAGSDWRQGLDELLRRLGEAAGVSRVTLWDVHPGPDGRLCQTCRHDWAVAGFQPISQDPRYSNILLEDTEGRLEDWAQRRSRGEVIQATLAEVTGETRQTFLEHSTLAFVSVPILLRDRWWGFLGFDDCVTERRWSELEIDILQTAAAMIAAAVERHEADERLRLSEERYALAARGAADGLFDLDLKRGRAYFAPRLYEILGLMEGVFGSSVERFFAAFEGDDAARVRTYLDERLQQRRRRVRFEMRRRLNGETRWFVARALVLYNRKGPVRAVGSLRDITDYRLAVDRLRRSEARSRAILDTASDAIITSDEAGRLVGCNPAAERMFGLVEAEAVGRPIAELLVPPHLRERHAAGMARFVAGGAPRVLGQLQEMEGQRADGTILPVELIVTEVPLPEGRLFTAVIRDISERKRYQQELAERERQRAQLARHFSPNMVEEMMRLGVQGDAVTTQAIAILFADLMNFTAISAALSPGEVVGLLRHFHALVEDAVFGNGGTLDKYMGDGVLATFGTPLPSGRDAGNAVRAARQLVGSVVAWNRERVAQGRTELHIAIGINYGEATLGNVGSARRYEHTVVGEAVNLASRIEVLTRTLHHALLISGEVVAAVRREGSEACLAGFSDLGQHAIRGHATPVALWGLTAEAAAPQGKDGVAA